jgi:REP element-mobilizing transposase RayT
MRNVRRFYVPNAIVFITLVTKGRRILFDLEHSLNVAMFLEKLHKVREFRPFEPLAYALLPDHVHLIRV